MIQSFFGKVIFKVKKTTLVKYSGLDLFVQ